jgi:hypothetical protein
MLAVLLGLFVLAVASPAQASPIYLTQGYPDYNIVNVTGLTYDAATDAMSLSGVVLQYSAAGEANGPSVGSFLLSAVVSSTGTLVSGSFAITTSSTPGAGALLLGGSLSSFGFSGTGNTAKFEFLAGSLSGSNSAAFQSQVGIIYNVGGSDFAGSFLANIDATGGTLDAFKVPEPATLAMLAGGGAIAMIRRRALRH